MDNNFHPSRNSPPNNPSTGWFADIHPSQNPLFTTTVAKCNVTSNPNSDPPNSESRRNLPIDGLLQHSRRPSPGTSPGLPPRPPPPANTHPHPHPQPDPPPPHRQPSTSTPAPPLIYYLPALTTDFAYFRDDLLRASNHTASIDIDTAIAPHLSALSRPPEAYHPASTPSNLRKLSELADRIRAAAASKPPPSTDNATVTELSDWADRVSALVEVIARQQEEGEGGLCEWERELGRRALECLRGDEEAIAEVRGWAEGWVKEEREGGEGGMDGWGRE